LGNLYSVNQLRHGKKSEWSKHSYLGQSWHGIILVVTSKSQILCISVYQPVRLVPLRFYNSTLYFYFIFVLYYLFILTVGIN